MEITNKCNLRCFGCPILNDEKDKPKDLLAVSETISILKSCHDAGMFAYSITGGEPFLKFDSVLKVVDADHGLDLFKLNTNCSFFKTISLSKNYLNKLKQKGLGERNKYIKPVLVISLGQQNVAGVPIQNAVNLASQIYNVFDPKRLLCSINITDANEILAKKIYQDFKRLYYKTTNCSFDERHFEVRFFSLSSAKTLSRLKLFNNSQVYLNDKILDFEHDYLSGGCFNIVAKSTLSPLSAETLIPRCVLRPNGDVYACPEFTRVHKIGNLRKEKIGEILEIANNSLILKTVFQKNLKGLYDLALIQDENLKLKKVQKFYNPCDVCQLLSNSFNE